MGADCLEHMGARLKARTIRSRQHNQLPYISHSIYYLHDRESRSAVFTIPADVGCKSAMNGFSACAGEDPCAAPVPDMAFSSGSCTLVCICANRLKPPGIASMLLSARSWTCVWEVW